MSGDRLVLASPGRANDGAFLAAADLAAIAADLDVTYRLIGGNAVSLLVAVHGVVDRVPARETADADFGAEYRVIADPRLLEALLQRGYHQTGGNRFSRPLSLAPLDDGPAPSWNLVIDVLAPSYEGRLLTNQPHGDLVVDEVPGLVFALNRAGTPVNVGVRLTTGHDLAVDVVLPDVVAAICLKAYSYIGRMSDRDAVDLWRLLEAAAAAGVTATGWPPGPTPREAATVLRKHFGQAGSPGLARTGASQADRTRIRALVAHVIGLG